MAQRFGDDMRAGDLQEQVILKQPTETNSFGSLTTTYAVVATVFAHVLTQRGDEAFEAARVNAKETIRIKMRYRADVTTKWRVEWRAQNYNITAVDRSMQRDGELWVTAQVLGAL